MMLTFGQYNVLAATRQRVTRNQLTAQTEFNELMVNYYMAGLLAHGLITTTEGSDAPYYQLTEAGVRCMIDYERHNPELIVSRTSALTPTA